MELGIDVQAAARALNHGDGPRPPAPDAARGRRKMVRDKTARPALELVDRQFTAAGPDRLWVADITYVQRGPGSCSSPSWSTRGAAGSSAGRRTRMSGRS